MKCCFWILYTKLLRLVVGINFCVCTDIANAKNNSDTIITNSRHYDALLKVLNEINKVDDAIINNVSSDLMAIDIRRTLYYFGLITGEVTNDYLLGNIFANFCIGK